MKTYDEFLTWAAEYHYHQWINDYEFNDREVAWGELSSDILQTAAVIYEHDVYNVNQSFKTRLARLYGNPLTGENGAVQLSGEKDLW